MDVLAVAAEEPVRNRVILALAYDAALRREELCSLRTDDLDPAHRTLQVRGETSKNRPERRTVLRADRRPAGGRPLAPSDEPGPWTTVPV
ncbi:site-specific integrase [Streptomyces sp. NPDC002403]